MGYYDLVESMNDAQTNDVFHHIFLISGWKHITLSQSDYCYAVSYNFFR